MANDTSGETADWFSEDQATFGDRLTAAREALGMSLEDLARRIGVGQETLAAWEADTAEPRANRIQMLAGLLNVSIRWLLTGEGDGIEVLDPRPLPPDAGVLLAELRELRAQARRTADRLGVIEKRLRAIMTADE